LALALALALAMAVLAVAVVVAVLAVLASGPVSFLVGAAQDHHRVFLLVPGRQGRGFCRFSAGSVPEWCG
jgi:hypothetical protein